MALRSARRRTPLVVALLTAVTLLTATTSSPAAAQAASEPERVLADLDFPTNLAFAPDGRLFFTEKDTGRIRVVETDGTLQDQPFATVEVALVANETGLLGLALHPDFEREPWVYAYYSDAASIRNVLVRIRADGDVGGEVQHLRTFLPATAGYHNGGDMTFGADGMLYLAVGEAHEPDRARDPNDPGGSILRLAPDGSAAPGNPFGDGIDAFTIGHRNSFGVCQDPVSDELWMTENGPSDNDEVNRLRAGADYGWPEVTGDSDGRFADPVVVFEQPVAPTGCAVWEGSLWFGTYLTGELLTIPLRGSAAPERAAAFEAPVIALEVAPNGDLYVATWDAIWRLAASEPAPTTASPTDRSPAPPASPTEPVTVPRADEGDGPRGVIAIVAAIVLAAGLALRLVAGRRLRRS
jgi:glucose/arabinose dehydrogenase